MKSAPGTTPITAEYTIASTSRSKSGTPSRNTPAAQKDMATAAPAITKPRGMPRCRSQPVARFPATLEMVTAAVTMAARAGGKPSRSTCRVGRKPMMANQQDE